MATRSTLETETQKLLDDQDADRFLAADIDGYLDEGQLEFNRRARIWKTTYLIVSAADQETYRLQPSGSVVQIYVTAAGASHSAANTVSFTAAPSGGTDAAGTIVVTAGGALSGVMLTNFGQRYVTAPSVTFSAGTGTANAVLNGSYGSGPPPVGPIERMFTGTEESPGVRLRRTTDDKLDILTTTTTTDWTAASAGTPTRFIQSGRDYSLVRLYVTPNGAATYNAYAAGHPPSLANASQEPVIPAQYHYILPYYAAFRCLKRMTDVKNDQAAADYKRFFDEVVEQAAREAQERMERVS